MSRHTLSRHALSRIPGTIVAIAVLAALPGFAVAQASAELDGLTATQAAADICAGKYSSEALISATLVRAKSRPELNAFITLDAAGSLKSAKAADAARKRGAACKPLGGVPLVIKDNIQVAGLPNSAGTAALKNFVPKQDAPVIRKLRAAGAIILGKTNVKMKAAGMSVVEVEMAKLTEMNGAVGFPVALYEAHDDMVTYLKQNGTGISIADLAKGIASPDVKGTYEGLVLPRKLPGPNNTLVEARPAYDAAIKTGRPALQKLYKDTFKRYKLDAIAFPTVPKVAIDSNPESSSLANFGLFIQNTDPAGNAGLRCGQIHAPSLGESASRCN